MLSYAFTEEQEDLRAMVREFAHGEIAPLVEEAEREEKFPVQVLPMLGELGLLGIVFPEEYGGIGADKITECIFVEEMAKVCAGITASVNAHADLAAFPIYKFGTDAQRERYLPRSIAGAIIGAYAITEPNTGSDAAGLASRLRQRLRDQRPKNSSPTGRCATTAWSAYTDRQARWASRLHRRPRHPRFEVTQAEDGPPLLRHGRTGLRGVQSPRGGALGGKEGP
jgi:hypothetical protein